MWLTIIIFALALGVCVCSYTLVKRTMGEMDDMRVEVLMLAENAEYERAEAGITAMLTKIKQKSKVLEMLTPHEDLHTLIMQLTDAKVSLSIRDMDDFDKAMSLFKEYLDHINSHEALTISNIF